MSQTVESSFPERLNAAKRYLSDRKDIAFAYLFGSRALGRGHPLSDVDIAIYLTEGPYGAKRLEILGDLVDLFHDDRVDLVILNSASPGLKARVVRARVILAENLPFVRHRFESLAVREYMDFSKMEQRILEQRYLHGRQNAHTEKAVHPG
jgi:hypothetical protein